MIPIDQFIGFDGKIEVQEGDTVEVTVDAIEDGFGETKLSREKAKKARAWVSLSEAYDEKRILEGRITGKVKGGFTVDLADIKAFLPGSLVDVRPVRETAYLEGKDLEFIVIKIDKKRNNVVVSRKAVLESENSEERDELIENLEEGSVIKGIVKNITDYGAFLDLGGVDGLLHITDMAWKRVRHPSELINIGDEIDVKVLKFDKEKTRVSLGLKQLNEDPWFEISKAHPEGSKLKGKITNIADYGCFVEIHNGVEGLVHVSEMDWTNKNANPEKLVTIGQEIEVMILDIDPERRRISLGIKQCQPNPWTKFIDNHEIGEIIVGKIKSITDFGIFIGLDDGIDGLVHLSDLSWTESGDVAVRNYKKGDELKTTLISADIERERISLGVKQLTVNKFQEYIQNNQKGSIVKGKIIDKLAKVMSIELEDSVIGTLKLSELASDKSMDSMQIEDELELIITNIDKKSQAISLSMKVLEKQNENKALDEYNKNNESVGTSLGDILKEQIDK
jgi:small subunit ribosomal protein S1